MGAGGGTRLLCGVFRPQFSRRGSHRGAVPDLRRRAARQAPPRGHARPRRRLVRARSLPLLRRGGRRHRADKAGRHASSRPRATSGLREGTRSVAERTPARLHRRPPRPHRRPAERQAHELPDRLTPQRERGRRGVGNRRPAPCPPSIGPKGGRPAPPPPPPPEPPPKPPPP